MRGLWGFAALLAIEMCSGVVYADDAADEALQLQRCERPETVNWRKGDGTPLPPSLAECAMIKVRAACARAIASPDHAAALALLTKVEPIIKIGRAEFAHLGQHSDLVDEQTAVGVARAMVAAFTCNEGALVGAELARAKADESALTKVADDGDAAIAAEAKAREDVVGPVCTADMLLAQSRAALVRERSNPSGVVDLELLHQYGDDIRFYQEQLVGLAPAYQALRHHPFTDWHAEGECVARRAQ